VRDNERILFHDEDESAHLATFLANDECFQANARAVAAEPRENWPAAAHREAKSYAPYRGVHRAYIVRLLLVAAEQPCVGRPDPNPASYFANLSRAGHWMEAPLEELDGRRVRERWETLTEGAQCFARFGAYRCINCGTAFSASGRYEYGPLRKRRSRRYHCDPCDARLGSLAASQVEAMRKVLDAATGQRRRSRAARRAP
jgi:hypothetical protein